ncbi:MAG: biotin--[Clostridia bacterium]|nr:biotin--[acetyl-CoA-carboxylase] ligase [Clostridia bacterium]
MRDFLKAIESNLKRGCVVDGAPLVDSTNRVVKERAEAGEPEGLVYFAEAQTAGRGRLGRSFFSPAGSGLYFSVLLRPKGIDPLKITVLAGVAVARAAEEVLGLDLQIKWVNDLYYKNKKVCGILAEGALSAGGLDYCVLGIGVNVFAPPAGFGELDAIAGALVEGAPENTLRGRLAASILNHFFALYERQESVLEEYRRRSYLQGKTVTAVRGNQRFPAKVVGIGEDYALLLETAEGILALSSGEVQLEDYR